MSPGVVHGEGEGGGGDSGLRERPRVEPQPRDEAVPARTGAAQARGLCQLDGERVPVVPGRDAGCEERRRHV